MGWQLFDRIAEPTKSRDIGPRSIRTADVRRISRCMCRRYRARRTQCRSRRPNSWKCSPNWIHCSEVRAIRFGVSKVKPNHWPRTSTDWPESVRTHRNGISTNRCPTCVRSTHWTTRVRRRSSLHCIRKTLRRSDWSSGRTLFAPIVSKVSQKCRYYR